jgi:hypothetical protein
MICIEYILDNFPLIIAIESVHDKLSKKLTISCNLSNRRKLLMFSYKIQVFWLNLHLK